MVIQLIEKLGFSITHVNDATIWGIELHTPAIPHSDRHLNPAVTSAPDRPVNQIIICKQYDLGVRLSDTSQVREIFIRND